MASMVPMTSPVTSPPSLAKDIDPGFEIGDADTYADGGLHFEVGPEWVQLEPFDLIERKATDLVA